MAATLVHDGLEDKNSNWLYKWGLRLLWFNIMHVFTMSHTFTLYSTEIISQFWIDVITSRGICNAHLTSFCVRALMQLSAILLQTVFSCLVLPLARYTTSRFRLNLGVMSLDEELLMLAAIITVSPVKKTHMYFMRYSLRTCIVHVTGTIDYGIV